MLKINALILADTGNYTCVVKNQFGDLQKTFNLEVQSEC